MSKDPQAAPAGRSRLRVLVGGMAVLAAITTTAATPLVASADQPGGSLKQAQMDLNGLGYNAGKADGTYSGATIGATERFQSDQCLDVNSKLDQNPATMNALSHLVEQVQTKVGAHPSGNYDSSTTAAVKKYQQAHHLKANGQADAATMKSMKINRVSTSCRGFVNEDQWKILDNAQSQLGKAHPAGSADFVSGVYRDSGIKMPKETKISAIVTWAKTHHTPAGGGNTYWSTDVTKALPGDLIVFGKQRDIAVVDHISGQNIIAISGHTRDPLVGSTTGVYEKTYSLVDSSDYDGVVSSGIPSGFGNR